jgi:hypothetical protein
VACGPGDRMTRMRDWGSSCPKIYVSGIETTCIRDRFGSS